MILLTIGFWGAMTLLVGGMAVGFVAGLFAVKIHNAGRKLK